MTGLKYDYEEHTFKTGEKGWVDMLGLDFLCHRYAVYKSRRNPNLTARAQHNSYNIWYSLAQRTVRSNLKHQSPTRLRVYICEMVCSIEDSRDIFQAAIQEQSAKHQQTMRNLTLALCKNATAGAEVAVAVAAMAGCAVGAPITLSVAVIAAGTTVYYEYKVNRRTPEACVAMGTLSLVPMGTEAIVLSKGATTTKAAITLACADTFASGTAEYISSNDVKQAVIKGLSSGLAKGGSADLDASEIAGKASSLWSHSAQKIGVVGQAATSGYLSDLSKGIKDPAGTAAGGNAGRQWPSISHYPQKPYDLCRRLVVTEADMAIPG